MSHSTNTQSSSLTRLQKFYRTIGPEDLTPLWEVLDRLVPESPTTPIQPAHWSYRKLREYVLQSGELISAQEAERRVLILENPGHRGHSSITHSLYAGLQLILPGEVAPAHRHSQSALRLVLEGNGAFTTVNGERITMTPGDFIITPTMCWHDHGNIGSEPVIWLDGLDIPLIQFLDAGFAEKNDDESQTERRPEGDSLSRYGSNMLPVDFEQKSPGPSPVCVYPFEKTKAALCGIAKTDVDEHLGYKLRFVNPATGASPISTIGTYAQYLPSGLETRPYRSSDGAVFCCLEGSGQVSMGDTSFSFEQNDVFVVPSWTVYQLKAAGDTILFSFSDKPVQQVLGVWREQKYSENINLQGVQR